MQVAEIQVRYSTNVKASDRPKVKSSACAFQVLKSKWSDLIEIQEEFNILVLDASSKVLGFYNLSKGGMDSTVVDPKLIFVTDLRAPASSVILAHNHPSGNISPSSQDIELTNRIVAGGKILGIQVLDHLILGPDEEYFSFADHELI